MQVNNITKFSYCYGCGVCSSACPKKIITLRLDKDGFYKPQISESEKCNECGMCLDICAFNYSSCALSNAEIHSWAAWSNDENIRQKCSSGGVGFEIGKQLIELGYKAVGCRYDTIEQRAEHYIAATVEDFIQSIGSKYIQSYTEEAFKQILRKGQKYLITGTPCQIDSLRRMIRRFRCEDNFILMDFFCHCVPSMHAWTAYIKMLEPIIGKIEYASWRNKFKYGWHDSWLMGLEGEKTNSLINSYNSIEEIEVSYQSRMSQGDLFYELFLGDFCLGPQCEVDCKYKITKSSADIRIGDLWGSEYKDNEKGVSALVSFTNKGKNIIEHLKGISLVEHPIEIVIEGQMKENAKRKPFSGLVMHHLRNGKPINTLYFKMMLFSLKVIAKLKRILL